MKETHDRKLQLVSVIKVIRSLVIPFADQLIDADSGKRVVWTSTKYLQYKLLVPVKLGFPMRIDKLDRR